MGCNDKEKQSVRQDTERLNKKGGDQKCVPTSVLKRVQLGRIKIFHSYELLAGTVNYLEGKQETSIPGTLNLHECKSNYFAYAYVTSGETIFPSLL